MIYIYNCYGGTHTSSLASDIHLHRLPADRIPTTDEILGVTLFNKLSYQDMRKLIFRGVDDEGNKVFSLGRGTTKSLIPFLENVINTLHNECGYTEKFILSNMSPTVPAAMTIGGFFSRGLGIDFIGVPLLVAGAKKAHSLIIRVVNRTMEKARNFDGAVLVLENKDMHI